jgi:CHAT domain-containing protein
MKFFYHIIVLFLWFLPNHYCFAANNENDLNKINTIRKKHFELGEKLDTVNLAFYINSKDKSYRKISKLIKLVYDFENNRYSSDKFLLDHIQENNWLKDSSLNQIEYLIIDDLFRVCVSLQRYKIFQLASLGYFRANYNELILNCYDTYIFLKTGNIYSFLENQNTLKRNFINYDEQSFNNYGYEVTDRLKMNIVSIGLSNFDTLDNKIFYEKLESFINLNIDSSSSFEDICFTQELSNIGIIENFERHNSILRQKLFKEYCSPFILNLIYHNLDWPNQTRTFLKQLFYKNRYPKPIGFIQNIDFYCKDYTDFNKNTFDGYLMFGQYDSETNMKDEGERVVPDISYLDTINSYYYYVEPNWIDLKIRFTINFQTTQSLLYLELNKRKTIKNNELNSTHTGLSTLRINQLKIHKIFDPAKIIDCSNLYYGPFLLLDYYNNHDNKYLKDDTTFLPVYDSLFRILQFVKNTNYLTSNIYTNDKYLFYSGMITYQAILKDIFQSSKQYNFYEIISSVNDGTELNNDAIPKILNVVSDKIRYLNFKSKSSKKEINTFDSTYLAQINYYIKNPALDSNKMQNRFYFFESNSKNILVDIYKRGAISDSLFLSYFGFLEALSQISERVYKDLPVYNQSEDSVQAINIYKNRYFCIDNSSIKFSKTNDSIYYKFLYNTLEFKNGKTKIDSNQRVIWYFLAENYDISQYNDIDELDFDKVNLDLYVNYSDSLNEVVSKAISLDSLEKIIDLNFTKSNQFFSSTYFNEINTNSKILYDILLRPIESFITSEEKYKIITPTILVALPLDYIYAKEKNKLPHFLEFSNIADIIYNNGTLNYVEDSITIFSEMIYNDMYCNINKSYTPTFRNGIQELKFSKTEREGIDRSMPTISYTGLAATKTRFIETMLNKRIKNIHLITHGAYIPYDENSIQDNTKLNYFDFYGLPKAPSERQLLLFSSDSTSNTNNNNLLVSYELKYLNNLSHINCIFLSACETGLIDDESINTTGHSGFVKEFLDRGAKSVIATRWKVQDDLAADFATKFYENLKKYKEYSQAFYETKLNFFMNKKNPFIWTSYLFVQ